MYKMQNQNQSFWNIQVSTDNNNDYVLPIHNSTNVITLYFI